MSGPKKVFYVMIGVILLVLIAGGGLFYYVDSLFAENAKELANLKADDLILEEKIRKGRAIEQQLEDIGFLIPVIEEVLPSNKEQSNLVAELTSIESQTGIELQNITFAGSDLSAGADPSLTQTEALESLGTVKLLPITTATQCVSFNQLLDFLEKAEENRRKMQITSIDISRRSDPNDDTCAVGNLDVNLGLEVYLSP